MDWIQGEKFVTLVSDKIIYCGTNQSRDILDKPPDKKFILVTHNSDASANGKLPDNLIRWFSQNVNMEDSRVESLPIGLENNKWFSDLKKRDKMLQKLTQQKDHMNMLYLNHNVGTNPQKRGGLYEMFEDKEWATIVKGRNPKNFDAYLDNIYNHKFVLCPEGNGIDTVRTWECLYMNTIPIEKRNLNNRFYTDLPICFVDDWGEVTLEFLSKEYERIKNGKWNMEKLTFEYWKNKINDYVV